MSTLRTVITKDGRTWRIPTEGDVNADELMVPLPSMPGVPLAALWFDRTDMLDADSAPIYIQRSVRTTDV